ncbi:hypothetical protein [Nitrobacter winogradskyi]|nr:hypothetical protein [Nitrobacter winogradskyi]
MADFRPHSFSQGTPRLDHRLRGLDRRSRPPHPGYEVTGSYSHYYIEMVETIAAWLKGARIRSPR